MRIFLSCQQALRHHDVPAYAFWEFYFKNALKETGHEVLEAPGVDWAEGLTHLTRAERSAWLGRTWEKAVGFLRVEHQSRQVDLFLSYLFPNQVESSAVASIRAMGIPCVNFFCDNVREFSNVPPSFGSFNLNWVPEAAARPMYSAVRMPFIYAPMPMWVQPKLREVPTRESEEVVFVGSRDELREDLLGTAIRLGLPIQAYGPGWSGEDASVDSEVLPFSRRLLSQMEFLRTEGMASWARRATRRLRKRPPSQWVSGHSHRPISGDGYFAKLRESQLVIGINRCPSFRRPVSTPIIYSRLRDIEAPMLGACYITEMAPGLEDLYEIGTEIETYRDARELVEKCTALISDPSRRRRMRALGQHRAMAQHTIGASLDRIATMLGIRR